MTILTRRTEVTDRGIPERSNLQGKRERELDYTVQATALPNLVRPGNLMFAPWQITRPTRLPPT